MNSKYVLFDLDGTLIDPARGITKSVAYALDSFGTKYESLSSLERFIGPPLIQSFIEYFGYSEEQALLAVEKYREFFREKGIFGNTLYEGIPEMLCELRENHIILAIATSKPEVFAKQILEHFGIGRYFNFVAGSNLDNTRTDKAEVIRHALRSLGVLNPPQNAVMAGDRMHDVAGARKNGLRVVGVTYGYGTETELIESGCRNIARSVPELGAMLLTMHADYRE